MGDVDFSNSNQQFAQQFPREHIVTVDQHHSCAYNTATATNVVHVPPDAQQKNAKRVFDSTLLHADTTSRLTSLNAAKRNKQHQNGQQQKIGRNDSILRKGELAEAVPATEPDLSSEQQNIIEKASRTRYSAISYICPAFPGGGKTTMLRKLADVRFEKGFGWTLLVTYSKNLKNDIRKMVKKHDGIQVENVHSLVCNVLWPGNECNTDEHLKAFLKLDPKPKPTRAFLQAFSCIAIDEFQDFPPLYFEVIQYLRSCFIEEAQKNSEVGPVGIVCAGEIFQWIFGMLNGSSLDFLLHPEKHFIGDTFEFCTLSLSFRLTPQMCSWLNKNMNPHMIAVHYPACWTKYGNAISKYWGNGLRSAKCEKCAGIHSHKHPNVCVRNYCNRDIARREVTHHHVKYGEGLLPQAAITFLQQRSGTLIVNGSRSRFRKFNNVTTPFSCKGQEFLVGVVDGFDSFVEQLGASKQNQFANREASFVESWPFAIYCQLYVGLTRFQEELVVVSHSDQQPFFTMRPATMNLRILPCFQQKITNESSSSSSSSSSFSSSLAEASKTQKNSSYVRSISKLFEFVPHDPVIDSFLNVSVVDHLCPTIPRVGAAPDTAPGVIVGTAMHGFAIHYQKAVIAAAFLRLTRGKEVENFTIFIRQQILHTHQNAGLHKGWVADSVWCRNATNACANLLSKVPSGLKHDKWSKFKGMNNERHCLHPFVWHNLRGQSGIHTENCGNVFISFESNNHAKSKTALSITTTHSSRAVARDCYDLYQKQSENRSVDVSSSNVIHDHHLAITNHILYLYNEQLISSNSSSPSIPISNDCYVINPTRGVLELVQLRNPTVSKIDFSSLFGNTNTYIGHLLRRKQWHDLLTGPFAIQNTKPDAENSSSLQIVSSNNSTSSSLGLSALHVNESIDQINNTNTNQNQAI